jgi:hypothetical protein
MNTYFRHTTKRRLPDSSNKNKFFAFVQSCYITTRPIEPMTPENWTGEEPFDQEKADFHNRELAGKFFIATAVNLGRSAGPCGTREEAEAMMVNILEHEGWTTDKALAERRAEKELELRISGKLRFAGPNFKKADFEACQQEIMGLV